MRAGQARRHERAHHAAALTGLACMGLVLGCAAELDTTREPVDTGSLGSTVVALACKRIAYLEDLGNGDDRVDVRGDTYRSVCNGMAPVPDAAPPALAALVAERDTLVGAIDTAVPEAFLPDVQAFLTTESFLALYDGGIAIAAVDALVELLRFAAEDPAVAPALHRALERLGQRHGYAPLTAAQGAVHAIARYPGLHELLLSLTGAIAAGGSIHDEWLQLLAAASITLRHAEPAEDGASPSRTGALAMDFLLSESPLLGPELPEDGTVGRPVGLARRDWRGLARVGTAPSGELLAPFRDSDGDGLADVDELGRFVAESGAIFAAPSPYVLAPGDEAEPWRYRDQAGRALSGPADMGVLLYEYVDLDRTPLAALVREGARLFEPDSRVALDALRGARALLGPRQQVTRTYDRGERFEYLGFDTAQAALLDMAHGYLQVLRDPAIDDLLALARTLVLDHEPELARLVEAAIEASRMGNRYPELALPQRSPLWDDLVPVLHRMAARPGLVADLVRALEEPEVAQLGQRLRDYMLYSDRFFYDATQRVQGSFATPVDRSLADSGFNRSLWQRLIHLIADSDRTPFCNKAGARIEVGGIPLLTYDACELVRVDNLAVFFVQSIVYAKDASGEVIYDDGEPRRKATLRWNSSLVDAVPDGLLDDLLQDWTGIAGFRTHPTSVALSRMLFLPETPEFLANIMDPPTCRDGHVYRTVHGDTLPVWERNGFYDQVRPILQVFADHDEEQLFVDLIVVLHKHWPSRNSRDHQQSQPNAPGYVWGSHAAAYEPLMADILASSKLLPALVETAPVLGRIQVHGRSYASILEGALRHLLEPHPGVRKRDGSTSSQTADGRPVPVLSPWQLLADAYERKRVSLEASGGDGQAWTRAISGLADLVLRGEEVPGEGWQFQNPRLRGLAVAVLDLALARIAAHDALGDRADWLGRELPARIDELAGSPLLAAAVDLVRGIDAAPAVRGQLEALLAYLLGAGEGSAAFDDVLTSLADVLQLAVLDDQDMVPMARLVGEALRPERGWVMRPVEFLHAAHQTDQGQVIARLARGLAGVYRPGHSVIGELVSGIGEVHRARPQRDWPGRYKEPYTSDDYRAILLGIADFVDDEKRGLRKFIAIIKGRKL